MAAARRVLAILVAVAAIFVSAGPARADSARNCTLTDNGEVLCWGDAAPVRVQVTGRVVQLAASGDSTCALTEPGEVYCWGAAEEPESHLALTPLLLIAIGTLLIGGGVMLVRFSRQGAAARAASRTSPAPSLSRSA